MNLSKNPCSESPQKKRDEILLVIAAIGICCIVIIFLQACASSINYSINTLNQEINVLEGDIDNLHVQLNSASGLDYVEEYATEQLGMIYPDSGQYVYTDELASSSEIDSYIAALTLLRKGLQRLRRRKASLQRQNVCWPDLPLPTVQHN